MGSIPVGDSDFFFVPRSRHAEYSIFSYIYHNLAIHETLNRIEIIQNNERKIGCTDNSNLQGNQEEFVLSGVRAVDSRIIKKMT